MGMAFGTKYPGLLCLPISRQVSLDRRLGNPPSRLFLARVSRMGRESAIECGPIDILRMPRDIAPHGAWEIGIDRIWHSQPSYRSSTSLISTRFERARKI
jgi:hypothetical protein